MQHTLSVSPRTQVGKTSISLNKEGALPAVVYGPKQEPVSITVPLAAFEALLRHGGEAALIELTGLEKPLQVLIHDLDRDPVTHVPRHADFYAVEKGAKITVAVALAFVGESPAVKAGMNLVKVLHEVEIESEPSALPAELEVDIEKLVAEGDQIHVSDIKAPKGVTILTSADEVVALAQAVAEETEEDTAAPDMDAIEVEKKGKDEAEDAE
ncbi:MAG: 50S ribosomal protein L25 [Patescibacteria group bacterium]